MGAVCTGAKSVDTDNSIRDKLSKEAKERLKSLQKDDPNASFSDSRLPSSFNKRKGQSNDKDEYSGTAL
jgi:hypothetical protein